nr:MAG TPA: hypothetical protein [Caudoviricetes sp.]
MPKVKFLMEPLNPESSPASAGLYSAGYRWTVLTIDSDGVVVDMVDFYTVTAARVVMFRGFQNANRRV